MWTDTIILPPPRLERRRRTANRGPDASVAPIPAAWWTDGGAQTGRSGASRRWARRIAVVVAVAGVVAMLVATTPPGRVTVSEAAVVSSTDPTSAPGASTLIRHADAVEGWLETTGLGPRHAVSLRWVIFNTPAGCSPPRCDADDVSEAADVAVGRAAVGVSRSDGSVSLAFATDVGAPLDDAAAGASSGLGSTQDAEIHLVLHDHGPVSADPSGRLAASAGVPSPFPPAWPADLADAGVAVQFTVHHPPPRSTP